MFSPDKMYITALFHPPCFFFPLRAHYPSSQANPSTMQGDDANDYQRVSNEARDGATTSNGYDAARSHDASWTEASSRVSSLDSGSRPQAPYSAVPDVSDEEDGADTNPAPSTDPRERASATTLVNGSRNDGKNDASSEVLTDSGEARWMPFYLRRVFLVGFAVVFILMVVALEVLYFVSVRDGGLATVEERLHYLWTYGPTLGGFVMQVLFVGSMN